MPIDAFKMKTFNVCFLPTCISHKQTRQVHNKISCFRFGPSTESLFLSGHPPVAGTIPACVRRFYPRVGGLTASRKGGAVGEQQPIRRRHRPHAIKAPRASPPQSERCCFPSERIFRRLASPPPGRLSGQTAPAEGFISVLGQFCFTYGGKMRLIHNMTTIAECPAPETSVSGRVLKMAVIGGSGVGKTGEETERSVPL